MTSTPFDGDSIGPQISLSDVEIPPHVGERLATLYGCDERIESGADWVEAIRSTVESRRGELPTEADLCRIDDGAHTVEISGESESFICVLDPLMVPFLREESGTVHSVTPEDGSGVTIDLEAESATVDPPTAVVSLGVSRDVDPDEPATVERTYQLVCAYVHAFASVDEYERWADGVDAATTSIPVPTGVAIARGLANELIS